jgi:hypothetical protein
VETHRPFLNLDIDNSAPLCWILEWKFAGSSNWCDFVQTCRITKSSCVSATSISNVNDWWVCKNRLDWLWSRTVEIQWVFLRLTYGMHFLTFELSNSYENEINQVAINRPTQVCKTAKVKRLFFEFSFCFTSFYEKLIIKIVFTFI